MTFFYSRVYVSLLLLIFYNLILISFFSDELQLWLAKENDDLCQLFTSNNNSQFTHLDSALTKFLAIRCSLLTKSYPKDVSVLTKKSKKRNNNNTNPKTLMLNLTLLCSLIFLGRTCQNSQWKYSPNNSNWLECLR